MDGDSDEDIWDYKSLKKRKKDENVSRKTKTSQARRNGGQKSHNIAQERSDQPDQKTNQKSGRARQSKSGSNKIKITKHKSGTKDSIDYNDNCEVDNSVSSPVAVDDIVVVSYVTVGDGEETVVASTSSRGTCQAPVRPCEDALRGGTAVDDADAGISQSQQTNKCTQQGKQTSRKRNKMTPARSSSKKTPARGATPAPGPGSVTEQHKRPQYDGHCPFCQMPFSSLILQSPRSHAMECMDAPIIAGVECPQGLQCDNTIPSHFRKFRHTQLADLRAGMSADSGREKNTESFKRKLSFTAAEHAPSSGSDKNQYTGLKLPDTDKDDRQFGVDEITEQGHNNGNSDSEEDIFSPCENLDKKEPENSVYESSNRLAESSESMDWQQYDHIESIDLDNDKDVCDLLADALATDSDREVRDSSAENKEVYNNTAKNKEVYDNTIVNLPAAHDTRSTQSIYNLSENNDNQTVNKTKTNTLLCPEIKVTESASQDTDTITDHNNFSQVASCSTLLLCTPIKSQKSPTTKSSRANGSARKTPSKFVHLKSKSPRVSKKKIDPNQLSINSFFKPSYSKTEMVKKELSSDNAAKPGMIKTETCSDNAPKPGMMKKETSDNAPKPGMIKKELSSDNAPKPGMIKKETSPFNMGKVSQKENQSAEERGEHAVKRPDSVYVDLTEPEANRTSQPWSSAARVTDKPGMIHQASSVTKFQVSTQSSTSSSDVRDSDSSNEQPQGRIGILGKVQAWMGYGKPSQSSINEQSTKNNKSKWQSNRQCPFYKKIPGTALTVDAFRYGTIPDCRAYLLSHFHYDHYQGLNKRFKHPIYCSKVTANLVKKKIRVEDCYLHPLPLNEPCLVDDVEITLLEANHCPGAVLFLLRLRNGKIFLHTGDFRASAEMELYPSLQSTKIHQLYLDTTYCDPAYSFPPQSEIIASTVALATHHLSEKPKTLLVCGSYTIGKEKLFVAIADALGLKICVTRDKKNILDCLEDKHIDSLITLKPREAQLHVLPMAHLRCQTLSEYLQQFQGLFVQIVAFEPTGWTHTNKANKNAGISGAHLQPKFKAKNVIIYGVPYSEHSSYMEMKRFVQFMRPEKIIPTVNNGNATSRKKMEALFKDWLNEDSNKTKKSKQFSIESWVS